MEKPQIISQRFDGGIETIVFRWPKDRLGMFSYVVGYPDAKDALKSVACDIIGREFDYARCRGVGARVVGLTDIEVSLAFDPPWYWEKAQTEWQRNSSIQAST